MVCIAQNFVQNLNEVPEKQHWGYCHPYGEIYSTLMSLEHSSILTLPVKQRIKTLVLDLTNSNKNRKFIELLMAIPWTSINTIKDFLFNGLRERYSFSMLSPDVIDIIADFSPIVELGAGNGYNAWLLQQIGCEVIPIDACPVEEGHNWFYTNGFGFPTNSQSSWTAVQKGNSDLLDQYPDHTLLMCWPPLNSMAVKALQDFAGKRFIFIGDKKTCANSKFYKYLDEHWNLEFSAKTKTWECYHTELIEIYSR